MHARRPEWVAQRIEEKASRADHYGERPYANNGTNPDYSFTRDGEITALDIVRKQERRLGRKLRILDLGAAAGCFVLATLEEGHEGYGVSLHDYREIEEFADITNQLPPEAYIVGDAHNLHDMPIPASLDLVVSERAFIHFEDGFSILEQAADRLGQDGIFAADGPAYAHHRIHSQPDIESDTPTVLHQALRGLEAAGFTAYPPGEGGGSHRLDNHPFMIERSSVLAPVRFAINYRQAPPA